MLTRSLALIVISSFQVSLLSYLLIMPPKKGKKNTKLKVKSKTGSTKLPSRFFKIPTGNMRTKEDVIKAFGYTIEKQLDKGGFGTIFIAHDNRKNTKVACKWMDLGIAGNDPRMLDTRNELTILEQVRHPYIVKVHCHFIVQVEGTNNMYIFMELAAGGNLYKYIQKKGLPDESLAKKYFGQILCGINHMHGYGIAHRDIKLQNVLLVENAKSLSGDFLMRVADFGLSTSVKKDPGGGFLQNKTICGTPLFMAPELYDRKRYDAYQVDIWALGVTLFILLTLEPPFDFKKPRPQLISDMKASKYEWPVAKMREPPSKELKDFTSVQLQPDPSTRLRLIQLINHEWIKNDYRAAHTISDQLKQEELKKSK